MKISLTALALILCAKSTFAQPYTIDISHSDNKLIAGHLKLGTNHNPKGEVLDANSLYFIRNGNPWYPVMGEFHFSRFPQEQWEESILKMKMAGIDVIATYVFWIYHEEQEGVWDWSGNRDLETFVKLCKKHGMNVFVRIGPWCHGEVRNGGFPDWLLQKNLKIRTNDSLYLHYAEIFFKQIAQQLQGLYFKDGGPVIGAQIENEYRFNNPNGLAHMNTLLRMAKETGMDVPYYTATGWPGSNIRQNELIPVWGGYPEAPWDKRTTQLPLNKNYLFDTLRSDPNIGNDLNGSSNDTNNYTGYRYPYATAEMGGGIQVTYHRRPVIEPQDVTALAYTKIGSGANLIGYYMFHGGHNSIGKLSTLQESKASSYPNDYPILNYDFQAPIGEWGELRPSYKPFKTLHLLLNHFGDQLAVCNTYFPEIKPYGPSDSSTARWSVRSKDSSGFIFISNYQRQIEMQAKKGVQFTLNLPLGKSLQIPQQPIDLPPGFQAVWPFNFQMGEVLLKYATAQPLCILRNGNTDTYLFFSPATEAPEFVFSKKGIKDYIPGGDNAFSKNADNYKIRVKTGTNYLMQFNLQNGRHLQILTLTNEQAMNSWKIKLQGKEHLIISPNDLIFFNDSIRLQNIGNSTFEWSVFPSISSIKTNQLKLPMRVKDGVFSRYTLKLPEENYNVSLQENTTLAETLAPAIPQRIKGADSTNFSMPLYGSKLQAVPGAKYYTVSGFPELRNSTHLSNAFLKINYSGDTHAAYLNEDLIADDFYYGKPMTIALKPFFNTIAGKEITLLVTPLSSERKIFFEKRAKHQLNNKAGILKVEVVPQYQVFFTAVSKK